MTDTRPTARMGAVEQVERVLAVVAILTRGFSVLLLVASIPRVGQVWPLLGLGGIAAGETLGFAVICWRRRAISAVLAMVDTVAIAAMVWPGALALPVSQTGAGPTYDYLMVSIVATGLAPWPPPALPGVAAIAAAAAIGDLAHNGQLGRAGVPDVLAPVWVMLLAWTIAALLRAAAQHLDAQRRRAVDRAAHLAREREQVHQAMALRDRLMTVMDELANGTMVSDPRLAERLRDEGEWLRELVTSGSVMPATTLLNGLRDLVTEKHRAGLTVHVRVPATEPALSAEQVEALLGATREALTNVAKHAGGADATVTVELVNHGVAVEISDPGPGFDAASVAEGTGARESIRNRVREVDGRVTVESSRAGGTRIRLWVPET